MHSDALGTGQTLPDWLRHSGFEDLKLTGVSDPQEALGGAAPGHRHRVCVPSPGTRRPQLQLPRWGRAEEQDPRPRPTDHAALQSPSRPHLHARRCDRVSRGHRGRREQRPRLTRQRQGLAGHRALGPFVLQTDRRLLKTGAAPHSGTAHGCRPSLRPPAQTSTVSPPLCGRLCLLPCGRLLSRGKPAPQRRARGLEGLAEHRGKPGWQAGLQSGPRHGAAPRLGARSPHAHVSPTPRPQAASLAPPAVHLPASMWAASTPAAQEPAEGTEGSSPGPLHAPARGGGPQRDALTVNCSWDR